MVPSSHHLQESMRPSEAPAAWAPVMLEGAQVSGALGRWGHARGPGQKRWKDERRQRKCFPGRHPHCLLPGRVSPESAGLVNLISCQNSHDNESWPAAATAASTLQPER